MRDERVAFAKAGPCHIFRRGVVRASKIFHQFSAFRFLAPFDVAWRAAVPATRTARARFQSRSSQLMPSPTSSL